MSSLLYIEATSDVDFAQTWSNLFVEYLFSRTFIFRNTSHCQEAVVHSCSAKRCPEKFHKIDRKTSVSKSPFKLSCKPPSRNFFKKKTPAQIIFWKLSCEFCEIFKNVFWQSISRWLLLNAMPLLRNYPL